MKSAKILTLMAFAFVVTFGCMRGGNFEEPTNYNLAINAFRDNDFPKAVTLFEAAMAEAPDDNRIIFPLAIAYGITGDKDREFALLQRTVEIDPEFEAGHYHIALAYAERGNTTQALENFRKVIELNPYNESAYFEIGKIYEIDSPRTSLTFFQRSAQLGSFAAAQKVQEIEYRLAEVLNGETV